MGEGRHLQSGDRAEEIVEQHEEEDGEQQRDPRTEVLVTEDVPSHRVAHEAVGRLSQVLSAGGNQRLFADCEGEQPGDQHDRQDHHQHVLAEAGAPGRHPREDLRKVGLTDSGWLEATLFGGTQGKR